MIKPNEWPLLLADMDVEMALKILRIVAEDKKLLHGYSTPFRMNAQYKLVGFVYLIDLLSQIRPLCRFNTVASILFHPEIIDQKEIFMRRFSL